jgi:hypothetical protein
MVSFQQHFMSLARAMKCFDEGRSRFYDILVTPVCSHRSTHVEKPCVATASQCTF